MHVNLVIVATPLWAKCEDETHTPKSGNLEYSGTPEISALDCKGQNTSHWDVLDVIGKVLKCRCSKWPRMSHLDICSLSYGQKKGRESNWNQTGNLTPDHKKSGIDQIPTCVGGVQHGVGKLSKRATRLVRRSGREVVMAQSPGSPNRDNFETISGFHFGSPGTKSHLGVGAVEQRREYYMGEGGGFPRTRAVVNQVSPRLPVACPNIKRVQNEF